MYTIEELITPEMAAEYLTHNKINRPLKPERVRSYAAAMKAGKWQLTHQGIAFKTNGDLADGQNRLTAIVMSGVPVMMNVAYDMDATILDRGASRSDRDTLIMSGIDKATASTLATSTVNFLFKYAYGCVPGDDVKLDFFNKYGSELYDAVQLVSTKSDGATLTRVTPIAAATFCALVCQVSKDGLKDFFKTVNSSTNFDRKMSAATQLRNHILQDFRVRSFGNNKILFATTTVAIRDAMIGTQRTRKYRQPLKPCFYEFVKLTVLDTFPTNQNT